MVNILNTLSRFLRNASSKIKNKTTNIRNGTQKLKENFSEAKNEPRSKRKSLLLGFTTVIGVFGVMLFPSVLPAVAKDVLKNVPKPGGTYPSLSLPPSSLFPSQQIITGLAGAVGTVCGLAIGSGSFISSGISGIIVVVGILKAQGK
jgi:hypothetical protein